MMTQRGVPVYDMMGTRDRGYPAIASNGDKLVQLARQVVNLANGDGDAEDVKAIRAAIRQCVDMAQSMNTAAQSIKPLIIEE